MNEELELYSLRNIAIEYLPRALEVREQRKNGKLRRINQMDYCRDLYLAYCLGDSTTATNTELAAGQVLKALALWWDFILDSDKLPDLYQESEGYEELKKMTAEEWHTCALSSVANAVAGLAEVTGRDIKFNCGVQGESNTSIETVTSTKPVGKATLKRLDDFRRFILLLAEVAKVKGVEFDPMALPLTKDQLRNGLNERREYKAYKNISDDTFENDWKAAKKAGICGSYNANTKNGKNFLKKLFG